MFFHGVPYASPTKPTRFIHLQDSTTNSALPCDLLFLFPPTKNKLVLKKSLKALFGQYGQVLEIVAHSNIRMRGQAFVVFEDQESASKALAEVQSFPLYGKPMVSLSSLLFFAVYGGFFYVFWMQTRYAKKVCVN